MIPCERYANGITTSKTKCSMLYQPMWELSIDERMVKSKARCHLVQYMKNKPVKWGFKYWVVADTSGHTVNFDLYTGKESDCSEFGLGCCCEIEPTLFISGL